MIFNRDPYKEIDGIPIYIKDGLTSHLEHQVSYFTHEKINSAHVLDPWQKSYVDRFVANFPDLEGKLILDAGSGSGYMSIELAKRGAKVVSVELTMKSLFRLKNIIEQLNLEDKITLACCDVQDLPFKDNTFDYYISNAVLEHVEFEMETISETNRVCKQKSGFMIAVPMKYKYLNPLLIPLNMFHDKRIGHLRRYDENTLIEKFKGWDLVKTYYTGHTLKVLKTVLNRIIPVFDESEIEKEDAKYVHKPMFSSNIVSFFKRDVH